MEEVNPKDTHRGGSRFGDGVWPNILQSSTVDPKAVEMEHAPGGRFFQFSTDLSVDAKGLHVAYFAKDAFEKALHMAME